MRTKVFLLASLFASSHALATPFSFSNNENHHNQMPLMDPSTANAFIINEASPAAPLFGWVHSTFSKLFSPSEKDEVSKTFQFDSKYSTLDKPDYRDKSIWQAIQEDEHLTDLKHVLKWSGPGAKELLDNKDKKLTFLAPVNWHHKSHEDEELNWFKLGQWNNIQRTIKMFENEEPSTFKDDEDKERKRKWLAFIIDATLKYHVIDGGDEPLKSWEITQNSTVTTALSIGEGKARDVLGNLFDGFPFRLRVGKSLLPRPSLYFNFYSRLVYPDIDIGGSRVHAVSLPLLIPPSALQTLFFSVPELGGTVSALQKSHTEGYFRLPFNHSAMKDQDFYPLGKSAKYDPIEPVERLEHMFGGVSVKEIEAMDALHNGPPTQSGGCGDKHNSHWHGRGQPGITLFAPDNLAWYKLPPLLRIFLWSPYGTRALEKVLSFHSLPWTIFYADFVHSRKHGKSQLTSKEVIQASQLISSSEWLWGPTSDQPSVPFGDVDVTRYTLETGLPKIHYNKTEFDMNFDNDKAEEFETVDVVVYRYKILPGGRGPLQTRVSVQGVSVVFQDIAVSNGALHTIGRFIKPKGHPHKGIWAHVAEEASKFGFGEVDLAVEMP